MEGVWGYGCSFLTWILKSVGYVTVPYALPALIIVKPPSHIIKPICSPAELTGHSTVICNLRGLVQISGCYPSLQGVSQHNMLTGTINMSQFNSCALIFVTSLHHQSTLFGHCSVRGLAM